MQQSTTVADDDSSLHLYRVHFDAYLQNNVADVVRWMIGDVFAVGFRVHSILDRNRICSDRVNIVAVDVDLQYRTC